MPKMKTHSGAKKRFSLTGSGKVRFNRAKRRHILEKKSKSMKRKARSSAILNDADTPHILKLLPNH
jgi:large subunit ribosomal protein L35